MNEEVNRNQTRGGLPAIDEVTGLLSVYAKQAEDVQKARIAAGLRQLPGPVVDSLKKIEQGLLNEIGRMMKVHPLWPWLAEHKGLGGPLTGRVIALIRDPRRFPGQPCSAGHIGAPVHDIGAPCPVITQEGERGDEKPCEGTMFPPRRRSGVRSLWHYLGVHVVDGKLPRRRKGHQADWHVQGRALLLMPNVGLAAQIVKHRTEPYRSTYDRAKARLIVERGVVESGRENDTRFVNALRPIQIDRIAQTIAVKAFIGDLLTEWKRVA